MLAHNAIQVDGILLLPTAADTVYVCALLVADLAASIPVVVVRALSSSAPKETPKCHTVMAKSAQTAQKSQPF